MRRVTPGRMLLAMVLWLPLLPLVLLAARRASRPKPGAAWTERDSAGFARMKRRAAMARADHEPDMAAIRAAGF